MPIEQPTLAYHYEQMLLGDLTGQASECQFPEPVEAPFINGDRAYRVYKCAECGLVLHVNGGKPDQTERLALVLVLCGFCSYPDFVRDVAYPEDLCRCFGWVYLDDED